MRLVAACAAALLAGCGGNVNSCRDGTVLVTVQFADGLSDADAVDVVLSLGGPPVSQHLPRTPGGGSDTFEVRFPGGYPAGKTLAVSVTATRKGVIVGFGSESLPLAAGCSAITVVVHGGDAPDLAVPPDLAMADLATPPDLSPPPDLSMADLTTPPDLAKPPDLSMADLAKPPDLSMPSDFSMADLAKPPDLSMPDLSMPDLSMPDLSMPDLAKPPDLVTLPDLVKPPDLVTPPDLAMPDLARPPDLSTSDGGGVRQCFTDADCRLFSSMCDPPGCVCIPLGQNDPNPPCKGMPIVCFIDPCKNLVAACFNGMCQAS